VVERGMDRSQSPGWDPIRSIMNEHEVLRNSKAKGMEYLPVMHGLWSGRIEDVLAREVDEVKEVSTNPSPRKLHQLMKRKFSQAQVDTHVPDPDSAEDGAKVYERVAKRGGREVWVMVMERVVSDRAH